MNTLTAEKRDLTVKAKRFRREGYVIGNLFGRNLKNSVPVKLNSKETTQFLKDHKKGAHITLMVDESPVDAIVKELQFDAMKHEITFINFQALNANQKVHTTAPIELLNEESVQNGIVEQSLSEIEYKAFPADFMDVIQIDLTKFHVGDLIHVKDLDCAKNDKISLVTPVDTLVVNIAEPAEIPEDDEDAKED